MSWEDMNDFEKVDFWGWLVALGVVLILSLMCLTVFSALKTHQEHEAYVPIEREWHSPYPPEKTTDRPDDPESVLDS